jgi:hypothetical protein
MSPRARAQHEPGCLADRRAWVDRNLAHAAERVEELRVAEWYRLRWRGLPGRGWGALAGSYQLLKVEEVRR